MQLKPLKTFGQQNPQKISNRVAAICWSPNNRRFAVADCENVIHLFDDNGDRKDKFQTKPSNPQAPQNYSIVSISFSPDSTKLAVCQSDGGVFVYKLGLDWGEKKSICNKFIHSVPLTNLSWPQSQSNSVIYYSAEPKIFVGQLKTNKSSQLAELQAPIVSSACSLDGKSALLGLTNGSVFCLQFDDNGPKSQGNLFSHSCCPTTIAWGASIVVAGSDLTVSFYDANGRQNQVFDYSADLDQREFTAAEVSPTGNTAIVGSFDRFHVFDWASRKGLWTEAPVRIVPGFYTISSLSWKPDGTRLIAGSSTGISEIFDCCLRKYVYQNKYEIQYLSDTQVVIRTLANDEKFTFVSQSGLEIEKVEVFRGKFVVGHTPESLIIGNMLDRTYSEVPWLGGGNEKFNFDNPKVCVVFNAGEITLIEYGSNRIMGSCRTEYMSPNLVSLKLRERKGGYQRIAYLMDPMTIQVLDLDSNNVILTLHHDFKIDSLKLSDKASKLLYRDRKRQLYILDVDTQEKTTLLNYCTFVQWVPNSDVIIAQSRSNMVVWYSVNELGRPSLIPIKGDIERVESQDSRIIVVIDEGSSLTNYPLDEGLIEFGTAVEDNDFGRAVAILENLEKKSDVTSMWKSLSRLALENQHLIVAERCLAAIGDVAACRYLRNINEMCNKIRQENPMIDNPLDHYTVRAKLAVLDHQYKLAEALYLEQGRLDEAMSMYQEMHKWDISIKLAESRNHPDLHTLKRNYFQWLLESGQEEGAAKIKEESGDYVTAVNLYLKGGMPVRASQIIIQMGLKTNVELVEKVASSLSTAGLHEKAGDLYGSLRQYNKALESYLKGRHYKSAIDLAREHFPQQVVALELSWAESLVSRKQMEAAVNHFIEAGRINRAIEVATESKQWKKVASIVDSLDNAEIAKSYYLKLGQHYAEVNDYEAAHKYFVRAEKPQEAVDMYTRAGKWDQAHALASTYMPDDQLKALYQTHANQLEGQGKLKEAEKLYLAVGEPDFAINMYKMHKDFENMVRLVAAYYKDLLPETYGLIAKALESEARIKEAEYYYLEAKEWKSAVNMYCANNQYEEAFRIAKVYGGPNSAKQIAYIWARSLGGDAAVKLLAKFGLLEAAIEFAAENRHFDFAFELARNLDKSVLQDVYYKQAVFFEDEGKLKEAEIAFVQASKPREAVLMYVQNENWKDAQAVAEAHDPSSVPEILAAQAKAAFAAKEYPKAETLLLRAHRPELMISMYKDAMLWKEALRFTREYLPSKLNELHAEYDIYVSKTGSGKEEILTSARILEQQAEFARAIEMYLKLTQTTTDRVADLEAAWGRALELTSKHYPDRLIDTIQTVAARFHNMQQYERAGQLYLSGHKNKDAVDCFIAGAFWDQARLVAKKDPSLKDFVENSYVKFLKSQGQIDALADLDIGSALDLMAQRGEWEKCLEKAASSDAKDLLNKYLIEYMAKNIKNGQVDKALELTVKYGVPLALSNFDIYDSMVVTKLKSEELNLETLKKLRNVLHILTTAPAHYNVPMKFQLMMSLVHLLIQKETCSRKKELAPLAAKQSVALLRFTDILRADKCFYDAGFYCQKSNFSKMAFICWNRFLDLTEAIEDGNAFANTADSEFAIADHPRQLLLPSKNLPEGKIEEVRDWVLSVSLDQKVGRELDRRNCEQCQASIYAPALACQQCSTAYQPCIVTGYPVLLDKISCQSCQKLANREDWNAFVLMEKYCPWCGTQQTPNYSLN